jgi:hypothetical protein
MLDAAGWTVQLWEQSEAIAEDLNAKSPESLGGLGGSFRSVGSDGSGGSAATVPEMGEEAS